MMHDDVNGLFFHSTLGILHSLTLPGSFSHSLTLKLCAKQNMHRRQVEMLPEAHHRV